MGIFSVIFHGLLGRSPVQRIPTEVLDHRVSSLSEDVSSISHEDAELKDKLPEQ